MFGENEGAFSEDASSSFLLLNLLQSVGVLFTLPLGLSSLV